MGSYDYFVCVFNEELYVVKFQNGDRTNVIKEGFLHKLHDAHVEWTESEQYEIRLVVRDILINFKLEQQEI